MIFIQLNNFFVAWKTQGKDKRGRGFEKEKGT